MNRKIIFALFLAFLFSFTIKLHAYEKIELMQEGEISTYGFTKRTGYWFTYKIEKKFKKKNDVNPEKITLTFTPTNIPRDANEEERSVSELNIAATTNENEDDDNISTRYSATNLNNLGIIKEAEFIHHIKKTVRRRNSPPQNGPRKPGVRRSGNGTRRTRHNVVTGALTFGNGKIIYINGRADVVNFR